MRVALIAVLVAACGSKSEKPAARDAGASEGLLPSGEQPLRRVTISDDSAKELAPLLEASKIARVRDEASADGAVEERCTTKERVTREEVNPGTFHERHYHDNVCTLAVTPRGAAGPIGTLEMDRPAPSLPVGDFVLVALGITDAGTALARWAAIEGSDGSVALLDAVRFTPDDPSSRAWLAIARGDFVAAGAIGSPAAPVLAEWLTLSEFARVLQQDAFKALRVIGGSEAEAALLQLLAADRFALETIDALRDIGTPSAIAPLEAYAAAHKKVGDAVKKAIAKIRKRAR